MTTTRVLFTLALLIGVSMLFVSTTDASPALRSYYNENEDVVPANAILNLLVKYEQELLQARDRENLENAKRSMDFGFSRGVAGAAEARHRMGMATANFAGGPGRRR